MKITFEGAFNDILDQMAALLERSGIKISTETYAHAQGPGPQTAVAPPPQEINPAPVANSGDKTPKLSKSEVAARMMAGKAAKAAERAAEAEKVAAEKAAAKVAAAQKMRDAKDAKKAAKAAPAPDLAVDELTEEEGAGEELLGTKHTAAPVDPADMVKIRLKTIEDLQTAYANGHQKEVFELLSRFGNGAKSFRELQPDAFLPIREAIDNGALT